MFSSALYPYLSAAVKDGAILADQRGPGRREVMAMKMSPAPVKLIEFFPQVSS
jgi:hypothetical protein